MKNLKGKLVLGSALALGLALANAPVAEASEQAWTPNSVETIKQSITEDKAKLGSNAYVIRWGDYLSGISEATGISQDTLAQINKISNKNLIFARTTMYFDGNGQVITQDQKGEVTVFQEKKNANGQTVVEKKEVKDLTQPEKQQIANSHNSLAGKVQTNPTVGPKQPIGGTQPSAPSISEKPEDKKPTENEKPADKGQEKPSKSETPEQPKDKKDKLSFRGSVNAVIAANRFKDLGKKSEVTETEQPVKTPEKPTEPKPVETPEKPSEPAPDPKPEPKPEPELPVVPTPDPEPTPEEPSEPQLPSQPEDKKPEVRTEKRTVKTTQEIPFTVVDNYGHLGGESKVIQEGKNGVVETTYEVTYQIVDGNETELSRKVIDTKETEPIAQVVARLVNEPITITEIVEVDDERMPIVEQTVRDRWFVRYSDGTVDYFYSYQEAIDQTDKVNKEFVRNGYKGKRATNYGTADPEYEAKIIGYHKIKKEVTREVDNWVWKH